MKISQNHNIAYGTNGVRDATLKIFSDIKRDRNLVKMAACFYTLIGQEIHKCYDKFGALP